MSNKIFPFFRYTQYTAMPSAACFGGQSETAYIASGTTLTCFKISQEYKIAECELDDVPVLLSVSRSENIGVAAFQSGMLYIFDAKTLKLQKPFNAHSTQITALQVTQDGRYVATGAINGNVRFWNTETQQLIQNMDCCVYHQLKTGGMTSQPANPQITKLQFNHNASWMYIGDAGGRVLIWDLTKVHFRVELFVYQQYTNIGQAGAVQALFSHPIERVLVAADGQRAAAFQAQDGLLISETPKRPGGFYGVFCPVKDSYIVSVRKNGIDIWDYAVVDYQRDLMRNALEYPFGNIIACAQRATSTIPQVLVLSAERTGNVYLHVISLKYIFPFCADDKPYDNVLKAAGVATVQPSQPSLPANYDARSAPRAGGSGVRDPEAFLKAHDYRSDILQDKIVILDYINKRGDVDIIEKLEDVEDCRLICDIIVKFEVLKNLELIGGVKLLKLLNKVFNKLDILQEQHIYEAVNLLVDIVKKIGSLFYQVVSDNLFALVNPRSVEFSGEERQERSKLFVEQVAMFVGVADRVLESCEPRLATIIRQGKAEILKQYQSLL